MSVKFINLFSTLVWIRAISL